MHKLDQLNPMTDIVADTGEINAIDAHQPLDATTNPPLLLEAAALPHYAELIKRAAAEISAVNAGAVEQVARLTDANERFSCLLSPQSCSRIDSNGVLDRHE